MRVFPRAYGLRKHGILAACAGIMLALPAAAQITVLGGGQARECFERVRDDVGGARRTAEICTRALEEEALSLADRAATLTNRGITHMREGALSLAEADFDRAVTLGGMSGDLALNFGALRLYQDRPADALSLLEQAVSTGTSTPHAALYNRAVAHEALGNLPAAYADYRAAQALQPDWTLPAEQLARFTITPAGG